MALCAACVYLVRKRMGRIKKTVEAEETFMKKNVSQIVSSIIKEFFVK